MHADYVILSVQELFGPEEGALDVPWATFVGDHGKTHTFTVPADDPVDPYLEVQAFDVGEYGHEIFLNDEPLTGFEFPPHDAWQQWMDAITGSLLQSDENRLRIERDGGGDDAFAVANVVVHWRASEP
ncbi:MAG: hypothetical protein ABEI57_06790 [Halapricum sp.]